MKFKALFLLFTILILPSAVLAEGLPRFRNPDLPPLKTPELSRSYEEMKEKLRGEGFEKRRFDPNQPLPMVEVESPERAGMDAMQIFKERFGNMWDDPARQMDVGEMPDDQFFSGSMEEFNQFSRRIFNRAKTRDNAAIRKAMAKTLDTSILWNMDEVRANIPRYSQASLQKFLEDIPAPPEYNKYRAMTDRRLKGEISSSPNPDEPPNESPPRTFWERAVDGARIFIDGLRGLFQ